MFKEKSASEVSKLVAFADLTPEQLTKAKTLVTLYKGVKSAQNQITSIKKDLIGAVKESGPIEVDGYVLAFVNGSEGLVISRDKIKSYLMEKYKYSEMMVEAFLAQISTKKTLLPSMKLIPKASLEKITQSLQASRTKSSPIIPTVTTPSNNPITK